MKRELVHKAQDRVMGAIVNEALLADEDGNPELAIALRREGVRLAKRYGMTRVHGLPETFK